MTVAARAERVVMAQMDRRRSGLGRRARHAEIAWLERLTECGDGFMRAAGRQHLTHERREHDEAHGEQAKPGSHAVAGA